MVGEYGRRWFAQQGIAIERELSLHGAEPYAGPGAADQRSCCWNGSTRERCSAVWVIYTDMKNGLEAMVRQERILPMHREHFHAAAAAAAGDKAYEFVPSAGAVLDNADPAAA